MIKDLDYGNKVMTNVKRPTNNESIVSGIMNKADDTSPLLWKPNNFESLSGHPVKREG